MVVSSAADDAANVEAIVYVAAFIPDVGESVNEIDGRYPPTPTPPDIRAAMLPTDDGGISIELSISPETFPAAFAAGL